MKDNHTLKKSCIDQFYINNNYVRNKSIWILIDETINMKKKYLANVTIIGVWCMGKERVNHGPASELNFFQNNTHCKC